MALNVDAERARSGRPIEAHEIDALESLGTLLRSFRVRAGLSIQQLADAANYHYRTLYAIEHGVRRTRVSALRHYAEALTIASKDLGPVDELHARLLAAAGDTLAAEPKNPSKYEERRARRALLRQAASELDAALEAARLKRVEQARIRAHWRWMRANRSH